MPGVRSQGAETYRSWYWTSRWRKRSRQQLKDHPLCVMCGARGLVQAAAVADHVHPHHGNERSFWSGQLQSLCYSCHNRDKQRLERGKSVQVLDDTGWPTSSPDLVESRHIPDDVFQPVNLKPSAIPLTIVCGPPASGKSRWVAERKKLGDVEIDLDQIFVALGYTSKTTDRKGLKLGLQERNRMLASLSIPPSSIPPSSISTTPNAWFVIGAPSYKERQRWATMLGAVQVVVLATKPDVCLQRTLADPLRVNSANQQMGIINKWWTRFSFLSSPNEVILYNY
jgi:hypothetical protein